MKSNGEENTTRTNFLFWTFGVPFLFFFKYNIFINYTNLEIVYKIRKLGKKLDLTDYTQTTPIDTVTDGGQSISSGDSNHFRRQYRPDSNICLQSDQKSFQRRDLSRKRWERETQLATAGNPWHAPVEELDRDYTPPTKLCIPSIQPVDFRHISTVRCEDRYPWVGLLSIHFLKWFGKILNNSMNHESPSRHISSSPLKAFWVTIYVTHILPINSLWLAMLDQFLMKFN